MLKRLINYLVAWPAWVYRDFFWELVALVPILIAAAVICMSYGAEPAYNIAGGLLLILGIVSVFFGVKETRRAFGQTAGWISIRQRLLNRPRWRKDTNIALGAATLGAFGLSGGLLVEKGFPSGLSADGKLQMLLGWINEIIKDIDGVKQAAEEKARSLLNAIEMEEAERKRQDATILTKMENVTTGGLSLTVAATVWLLAGTVLTTFSGELKGTYFGIVKATPAIAYKSLDLCEEDHATRATTKEVSCLDIRP